MISYVKGTAAAASENYLILENGSGIGFKIYMPITALSTIMPGGEVKVYTHMAVKEDDISLYGFLNQADLEMFQMLLLVSGIGPKAALGIMSFLTTDELKLAIAAEDPKMIAKAKGVGAKTAQKVVIELKGKVSKEFASMGVDRFAEAGVQPPQAPLQSEALAVLEALGFSRSESLDALSRIDDPTLTDASSLVSAALKLID